MREDRTPGGRHRHRSLQDHRPKKQQQRPREEATTNGAVNEDDSVDSSVIKQPEIPTNKDESLAFIKKIRENVTQIPDIPGHSIDSATGAKDVTKLMDLAYQELYKVIQWAKDVPGFKEIDLEDQVCLLKACFMDLNVFRMAYRSVPCDPMSLRFGEHLILERNEVVSMGWTEDLVDTTLEFTDKLRSLNVDPNEFACLSALVLLCPGWWSDQHQISPCNINYYSTPEVMRS